MTTVWIHKTSTVSAGCCRNGNCFSKRKVKNFIFKCSVLLLDNQPTLLESQCQFPWKLECYPAAVTKLFKSCRSQLWQLTEHYKCGFLNCNHQHGERRSSRNFLDLIFQSWVCSLPGHVIPTAVCGRTAVAVYSGFCTKYHSCTTTDTTAGANYTRALVKDFSGPTTTPAK